MGEEKVSTASGELWFGYVGPWFDGSTFSRHEVHMGFLNDEEADSAHAWDDAKRYTKFRWAHKEATWQDWTRLVECMKPLHHMQFHPQFYAVLFNTEAFGRAFPIMFNGGPIFDQTNGNATRTQKLVSNLEFVVRSFLTETCSQNENNSTFNRVATSAAFWSDTCTIL